MKKFFRFRRHHNASLDGGASRHTRRGSKTGEDGGPNDIISQRLRLPRRGSAESKYSTTSDASCSSSISDDDNSECSSLAPDDLAHYHMDDVVIGELLGQGTFATVHAIVCFATGSPGGARMSGVFATDFALKRLQPSKANSQAAVTDLATEAWLLHQLPHKHMVALHAMVDDPNVPGGKALVVDKLVSTLREERKRWYQWAPKDGMTEWRALRPATWKHVESLRTQIAHDLASALAHLHKHFIVHRDIKPSNIGFDSRGTVKLFDFGFCRSLPVKSNHSPNQLYKLTARMGTWRYMAPEVARGSKYNCGADVYSFALVLWEMLVGTKPFANLANGSDELKRMLQKTDERPPLEGVEDCWVEILEGAWSPDVCNRTIMADILKVLEQRVAALKESPASAGTSASGLSNYSIAY